MSDTRIRHSRVLGKLALCAALALAACSTGGGSGSPLPLGVDSTSPTARAPITAGPGGGAVRSVAGDGTASTIAYFAIGASNYCPSAKGTIQIQIVAANSQGALITGTYSPEIVLSDSDTSGATKLSTLRVSKASQAVTLAYSGAKIGAFHVIMTVGTTSGYAGIAPGRSCINSKPSTIVARDGAAGTAFTLSGAGGPYKVLTPTSGSGCGSAVTVKQNSATQFVLTSATSAFGYCYVEPRTKTTASAIGVVIVKK